MSIWQQCSQGTLHIYLMYNGHVSRSECRKSHYIYIDNSFFDRLEEFKYLGTTLTNQNSIPEKIKSRLKSGNVCYHLAQNLVSSNLLPKILKINLSAPEFYI
jgi:hypothetical protein